MKRLVLALACAFSTPVVADTVACRASVPLRQWYDGNIDTETGATLVTTSFGRRIEGVATRITGDAAPRYFLATGFGRAIELQVETTGRQRIALCLGESECYLCSR